MRGKTHNRKEHQRLDSQIFHIFSELTLNLHQHSVLYDKCLTFLILNTFLNLSPTNILVAIRGLIRIYAERRWHTEQSRKTEIQTSTKVNIQYLF
jgi:hypothetical protein